MSSPAPQPTTEQRFLPVALDSLDFAALEMDLYLRTRADAEPTLYRAEGVSITPEDTHRLEEQGVKFLYIRVAQHAAYRRMLARKLDTTVRDAHVAREERWKAVRSSCEKMISDVLLLPGHSSAVEMVGDIGRAFGEWSSDSSLGFEYMLDMSAHDFYTTSHMVNVGVGCGLLAKELRPGDIGLMSEMVQGGMLHDVGKRGIPETVLNKEGKLDADEWALIQKHPALGFAELSQHPTVASVVPLMARDHHERLDGKGYPGGLEGPGISFAARVCAVVDVYDAITAARPYRGPTAPKDALRVMREGRGTQFDPAVFDAWEALVDRLVREDPARAVSESGPKALAALEGSRATAHAADAAHDEERLDPSVSDRRRHTRLEYRAEFEATLVRSGKSLPVKPGEMFTIRAVDLSKSGVGLVTPWPLSLGDVLMLFFPSKNGKAIKRCVQVVRVRRGASGEWLAGTCFVEGQASKVA